MSIKYMPTYMLFNATLPCVIVGMGGGGAGLIKRVGM